MDTQAAQPVATQDDSAMPLTGNVTTDPANLQPMMQESDTAQATPPPSLFEPQPVAAPQPDPSQDTSAMVSVIPQAMNDAANDSLNPANATSARGASAKELAATGVLENLANEIPGAQAVEQERTPEISPELESWMEKIEHHEEKPPERVVVADKSATNLTGIYAADPVVVLPMTQSQVKQGMQHPVTDSVKWLAEWCIRIMKKFHGSVVYRPLENDAQPK